jgi:hypothetical protein
MTSRYGRNQRRAHRQRIAELEVAATTAEHRARSAEARLSTAREDALRQLVRSEPYVQEAMRRVGSELGRAMGPHFAPHVEKLMQANQRRGPSPIRFDAAVDPYEMTVSYIEGRIEPIVYRIALAGSELFA